MYYCSIFFINVHFLSVYEETEHLISLSINGANAKESADVTYYSEVINVLMFNFFFL